jgi:heme exporter protein B
MPAMRAFETFWRLVQKDATQEVRARRALPAMLLLGLLIVLLITIQVELPTYQKLRLASGSLWLAVFFAGVLSLERSFAAEREEGCWHALLLYPVSPSVVFFAKAAINVLVLACLEAVLVPAVTVFSGAPLLNQPLALILVAALGNVGFASVGVVMSGLTAGLLARGSLLALLMLPLMVPVMLGASEATRLAALGDFGEMWWRWIQLLAAFAVMYTTVGVLVFEFVLEE